MTKDQRFYEGEKEMEKRRKVINPQIPAHAKAFLFFPTSKEDELNKS